MTNLPEISTEAIARDVVAGVPFTIQHGLGRQVQGWLCLWATADCTFHIQDPTADTARELTLIPSASASVRLVLL